MQNSNWGYDQKRIERYLEEAQGLFDDLTQHVDTALETFLRKHAKAVWKAHRSEIVKPPKSLFVFLGEGPIAQRRRLEKLAVDGQALLWLQARVWALQATIASDEEVDFAMGYANGYRKAFRRMAEAAQPLLVLPALEDVLPPSLQSY